LPTKEHPTNNIHKNHFRRIISNISIKGRLSSNKGTIFFAAFNTPNLIPKLEGGGGRGQYISRATMQQTKSKLSNVAKSVILQGMSEGGIFTLQMARMEVYTLLSTILFYSSSSFSQS
jgi:hypothetical protein